MLKTEPDTYSFEDLERDGKTVWDGVMNYGALKLMRHMRKGDGALIFHTGRDRCLAGIAQVANGPYPDPLAGDDRQVVVEVEAVGRLPRPVPLERIRNDRRFASFELVRSGRLAVLPVNEDRWKQLLSLAGA